MPQLSSVSREGTVANPQPQIRHSTQFRANPLSVVEKGTRELPKANPFNQVQHSARATTSSGTAVQAKVEGTNQHANFKNANIAAADVEKQQDQEAEQKAKEIADRKKRKRIVTMQGLPAVSEPGIWEFTPQESFRGGWDPFLEGRRKVNSVMFSKLATMVARLCITDFSRTLHVLQSRQRRSSCSNFWEIRKYWHEATAGFVS